MDRAPSKTACIRPLPRRGLDAARVRFFAWGARLVVALFLLVFTAQVTGVAVLAADECCASERAAAPEPDEDCTPFCSDCLCCPHVRATPPHELGAMTLERPRTTVLRFALHALLRGEEHPRRVDHVPRALA